MALVRQSYQQPSITGQAEKVLAIAEQLKGSYKGTVWDPANAPLDVEKSFAPSHLFFTDKDLYYSEYQLLTPEYVQRFLDFDPRAPYRDTYKRTEVGLMYPTIVKKTDIPGPGDALVWKRREPVNIWQDECADIEDIHYKNFIDFRVHEYKQHFLGADSYSRIKAAVFDAMRKGNAAIEKLWVDTFIANLFQIWSYPRGDKLFQFFAKDDSYVPEDSFSKVTRGFYLKDGEMKKRIIEFGKWVRKYYVNRQPYLTNTNTHEVIGMSLDKSIPKWDKVLVDRSDEAKSLAYARNLYLEKDQQQKYTRVGYNLRRNSLTSFSSVLFRTIDRMMTDNAFNWCGYTYGKDVKDTQAYPLACRPQNLVVILNGEDLTDMNVMLGSDVYGPFTEQRAIGPQVKAFENRGISFYGVPYVLPGMAAVIDTVCFRLIEYFNETYSKFFEFDLVEAVVHHMMKRPILYRYTACTVIEPGKDQKYAAPIAWASEHLPLLVEG